MKRDDYFTMWIVCLFTVMGLAIAIYYLIPILVGVAYNLGGIVSGYLP